MVRDEGMVLRLVIVYYSYLAYSSLFPLLFLLIDRPDIPLLPPSSMPSLPAETLLAHSFLVRIASLRHLFSIRFASRCSLTFTVGCLSDCIPILTPLS